MANEAKRILTNYLHRTDDGLSFRVSRYGITEQDMLDILSNWHAYESPDIYSLGQSTIYGLEHFEFDAYRRNRKGSIQRGEYAEIRKTVRRNIEEVLKTKDSATTFHEIKSRASESYYKENFVSSFKEHYATIDNYREHLSSLENISKRKISIWFMAEDTTPLGSHFICRNKLKQGEEPSFPIFFPEIEELFLTSTKLGGIIFADSYNKVLTLVKRDRIAIKELKVAHHYRGEPLFFYEPKFASIATKIPNLKRI